MAANTLTSADAALKELYVGQGLEEATFSDQSRVLSRMFERVRFSGRKMPLPLVITNTAGAGADFKYAQTSANADVFEAFELVTKKEYAVANVEVDAIERTGDDKGAFVSLLKRHVDSAIDSCANKVESALFGDGSGQIGRISNATGGTKVITLTNPADVANFFPGVSVVAGAATTGAIRSTTPGVVDLVDRAAGTVTLTATITSGMDGYQNDYLFWAADRALAGSLASPVDNPKMFGLAGWLPGTAPTTGDSFLGVDRSIDPTRYAGSRVVGDASSIEESIMNLSAVMGREGAYPDTVVLSYDNWRKLALDLGANVTRDAGGKGTGGFSSLSMVGYHSAFEVIPANKCPDNRIYILTKNTWKLACTKGELVSIIQTDGLRARLVSDDDVLQTRVASRSALGCIAPVKNGVITL